MPKSIALCLIVKRDDLKKSLNAIESVKNYVDEICVTITDKPNGEENEDKIKFSYLDWEDDFAKARNFNFSQAKSDWILWLDADDTLENPENLRELIEQAELNRVEGYFLRYKYNFDSSGNCIDEHWKAQLLKNNGHFRWQGAIHEDPIQERPANWAKTHACTRVHHSNEERTKESYARNLRILLKEVEKNPNEPRTLFYLGRTYLATKEYDKCIESLTKYLELSGWDDERYEATLIIGSCYFQSGQYDLALEWYHLAILEKESYPDAYIQKGFTYLKKEDWKKAINNFKIALQMNLPDGQTYFNPMLYKRDLYLGIATAYIQLAEFKQALQALQYALRADKNHADTKYLYNLATHLKSKYDTAEKYVQIAKFLDNDQKVLALLSSVPASLQDNPLILGLKNMYLKPKVWGEKSIAIYCGPTVENWTPDSIDGKGIGGSETAVVELSKRLVKHGWKVTVFNSCDAPPEGLDFEGVTYQNYWSFNVQDEFDVLWSWRLPELFDYEIKARLKVLDLHDTMTQADFTPERLEKIDKIFVKTNYHRSLYPNVPDEKFTVIGNGIDLKRFEGKMEKDPYRFCYTSTPNRGLDVLLKMWPKIKEKLPEATLHVYYGWKTFYELEKNNPERMAWMKKIQDLMKQDGVVDHGRVGQKELAEDLLKTSYWLYPTYFPEIHCITACEMQAAGVIPITSGYAALEETQLCGPKIKGDVYDPEWQKEFIERTIKVTTLNPEDLPASIQEAAKQFDWDLVAEKWNHELRS